MLWFQAPVMLCGLNGQPGGIAHVGFRMQGPEDVEEAVRRAYCSGAPDGERSLTATAWVAQGIVP